MEIRLGLWKKINGRKIVKVVNCMYNTVYFYSDKTGTHYQRNVNNFIKKYKPKGE